MVECDSIKVSVNESLGSVAIDTVLHDGRSLPLLDGNGDILNLAAEANRARSDHEFKAVLERIRDGVKIG